MSTNTPPPLHDTQAEKAVLGAMLRDPKNIPEILDAIIGPDFHHHQHETIFNALAALHFENLPIDAITTADRLTETGDIQRVGGTTYLLNLIDHGTPGTGTYYADIVRRHAIHRRAITILDTTKHQLLTTHPTPEQLATTLEQTAHQLLNTTDPGTPETIGGTDIATFLAGHDDQPDWLIPGLLEHQDRLIVTAAEGAGKSTLLRQIAVMTAAGLHPFTNDTIPPARVAILDLENSARQIRRHLRPLAHQAGPTLNPRNLIVHPRPEGIDLTDPADRLWLDRFLDLHKPDLIVTGPIYKMGGKDPNSEEDTKPVALHLDAMRVKHGTAIILEAHSRKSDSANPRNRPKEPFGWSGWMRWPEFGIHLAVDGASVDVTHWRGMREERDFPEYLNRGGQWPFTASVSIADQQWQKIRAAIRSHTGTKRLTIRELADITSIPKTTVDRVVREHQIEVEKLYSDAEIERHG